MKKTFRILWAMTFLAAALGTSWPQQSGQQPADSGQPPDNSQQSPENAQQPATPPSSQDNTGQTSSDNPPISGLDQPALESRVAARSFLIPGLHISQAADSNVTGASGVEGVTRVLGSLTLQRLWSHYDFALDYVGGGSFYTNRAVDAAQIQQLDSDQRILWRTGQLAIRDSFSYLPEGSFGYGAYGGTGTWEGMGGILTGGLGGGTEFNFFGPGQFASVGQEPRITNLTLVDVTEEFSPRSSITATGSYGLVHFTDNVLGSLIDSRQIAAQAGYSHQLNRKDQIAVVFGFQAFRYPSPIGSDFNTYLWNVLYGHRISGRMDLVVGGGPQLTDINNPFFGSTRRLSMSGRASLRYRFPKTVVGLYYDRYNTSGSGFFAGAVSDVARVSASRPFGRQWTGTVDLGYTHNSRLTPSFFGIIAQSYNYGYAGGSLHRQLGRNFSAFVSYQFNDLAFDSSFCGFSPVCARTTQRHVGVVGLDWHPHPIRLD